VKVSACVKEFGSDCELTEKLQVEQDGRQSEGSCTLCTNCTHITGMYIVE
jgi:hypothetical protein